MAKGNRFPNESKTFRDERTGAAIRQVTDHPSIHHHPFYYLPPYDDSMRRLYFVSHRTGRPEIFCELQETGEIVQLTDQEAIGEWSVHPSHDGKFVYYTAGTGAWRVDVESFQAERLLDFGKVAMREKGMVGAAMGTTTVSCDDRWWATPVKAGDRSLFYVIDTQTGKHEIILERDSIGHPQFHPDDATLLRYAGPYRERIWVINRDGSGNRLAYERDEAKKEWIVHETWAPGKREIATTNWPYGMFAIDIDSGERRPICSFNAWHPRVNREGTLMVCDTNFPDRGLMLFDPNDGIGEPKPLCESKSSNQGAHWNTDHCPYDDGPVQIYAPQHTHPHPAFSPDGSKVVFTSDRTGYPQVYEVDLPG
jgi:oligogalacturonide lyase